MILMGVEKWFKMNYCREWNIIVEVSGNEPCLLVLDINL